MLILRQKRPDGSETEKAFVAALLKKIPGLYQDKFGNCIITVGAPDPVVCFSSHTDTVHKESGEQDLVVDMELGMVYKDDGKCLGADDGTGIWLMIQMIREKIPGLYIFHRAEEVGGKGSAWIQDNTPGLIEGVKFCIAFDRKGYTSIITHQRGGRCCSQAFVDSLAKQLAPMDFKADATGTFTDSANYTDTIPECTNLSVGYFSQHTQGEHQDLGFLADLLKALMKVKWDELVVGRDVNSDNPLTRIQLLDAINNTPDLIVEFLLDIGVTHYELEQVEYLLDNQTEPGSPWDYLL